jgi:toxin ParE1/3/4
MLEFAKRIGEDFRRIVDHLHEYEVENATARIDEIIDALQILTFSPLIGRPIGNGRRELIVGRGAKGYVALYRFVTRQDLVLILALKSQREVGYRI